MIRMHKKTIWITFLSLVLCFGTVWAGVPCDECDPSCFVKLQPPHCGSDCQTILDLGFSNELTGSAAPEDGCCEIEKCNTQKPFHTNTQKFNLKISSLDTGIMRPLLCDNKFPTPVTTHQYNATRTLPIYTLIQSFLC